MRCVKRKNRCPTSALQDKSYSLPHLEIIFRLLSQYFSSDVRILLCILVKQCCYFNVFMLSIPSLLHPTPSVLHSTPSVLHSTPSLLYQFTLLPAYFTQLPAYLTLFPAYFSIYFTHNRVHTRIRSLNPLITSILLRKYWLIDLSFFYRI